MGNGRQNHKFSSPKNRGGILLYCAGADGNTCGRKSRGDEKQPIDLEWPYVTVHKKNMHKCAGYQSEIQAKMVVH